MNMMLKPRAAAIAAISLAGIAQAGSFTVDVSGIGFYDFRGDPDNTTILLPQLNYPGCVVTITGVAWDVNLTTVGLSWADEATMAFVGDDIEIIPGFGDAFSVSNMNYQGVLNNLEIVLTLTSGALFEFYETGFDDNPDALDAYFEEGSTITFYADYVLCPTPGSCAPLAAGLVLTNRRRR